MSRRNVAKKRFPDPDPVYNSYLVSLLVARILYSGKKTLAQKIIVDAFEVIKMRTDSEPLAIFEKAVKNTSPLVEVKSRRVGGSNYQVPIEVSDLRATNLSLRALIKAARERSGKTIAIKLANELIDASNNTGTAVRKKEEMHQMAEANKAFAHFRY